LIIIDLLISQTKNTFLSILDTEWSEECIDFTIMFIYFYFYLPRLEIFFASITELIELINKIYIIYKPLPRDEMKSVFTN